MEEDIVTALKGNYLREIEREFKETENSWLNCFGSILAVVNIYINLKRAKESLSPEILDAIRLKLEVLKERRNNLAKKTTGKDLPKTTKDDFLASLKEILDILP